MYFAPDSVTWRVHADPSMVVAGIRALLQQALHPEAMAGFTAHSSYREGAWGRLARTAEYVAITTYAPKEEVDQAAARVRKIHHALGLDAPHLLRWVHVSMVDSFLDVAKRSGMALSDQEADQYLLEMKTFAQLIGIDDVPTNQMELKKYFHEINSDLIATPEAIEGAKFIVVPPMPTWVRLGTPAQGAWAGIAALALAALPQWAKTLYGLPHVPGDGVVTNASLRMTRLAFMAIPESLREGPHRKAARERLTL